MIPTNIKKGVHLTGRCFDTVVTSVTDKFVTGYSFSVYKETGKFIMKFTHHESFLNRFIVADLQIKEIDPKEIATDEEFNYWPGLQASDISNIEEF
ncbi:hypothetical protein N6B72_05030 [Chryseobacterium soli]|uniref:hypothetical protein n=1 Tax=Chryseobacterium soli TaxID=445961 RepID=UPI002952B67B|nr:hypothetical protein [Chryseobacterium soli]MDV7696280.1 hypothetical protein [Chryseobacterium soli]